LHIVTKIKAMQTVIENCQKLTALLIEYREAKIYEKCLYHVVSQSDRQNMFFLVEIKTGTIKRNGTPDRLKGWLRLRQIKPETVYNYGAIA